MIPARDILGVMKVLEGDSGNAVIEWRWQFDVEPEQETQAKEMLAGAGTLGIQGIERLIHAQAAAA